MTVSVTLPPRVLAALDRVAAPAELDKLRATLAATRAELDLLLRLPRTGRRCGRCGAPCVVCNPDTRAAVWLESVADRTDLLAAMREATRRPRLVARPDADPGTGT